MNTVAIVYYSGYGHTARQAQAVTDGVASVPGIEALVVRIPEDGVVSPETFEAIGEATAIIYGSPTYMGGPSWQFKRFADATSKVWIMQSWKDKLAAGFTNSASLNGDKGSTISYLFTLSQQHGQIWVGTGLLPSNRLESGHGDVNYAGGFAGALAISPSDASAEQAPRAGDLENGAAARPARRRIGQSLLTASCGRLARRAFRARRPPGGTVMSAPFVHHAQHRVAAPHILGLIGRKSAAPHPCCEAPRGADGRAGAWPDGSPAVSPGSPVAAPRPRAVIAQAKPVTSAPLLHYVYDPLCGWCYAAAPLVAAAAASGVTIALHGGGLFDPARHVPAEKRQAIRMADRRIAALTGQTFASAYLDGLLADPRTMWWSRPAIAAVLAADAVDPGSASRMLHAIQQAQYREGLRVGEAEVLADVARGLGIDAARFLAALRAVPVDHHIRATRLFMARVGVNGFPAFILEAGGRFRRIPHDSVYGDPPAFVMRLRKVAG